MKENDNKKISRISDVKMKQAAVVLVLILIVVLAFAVSLRYQKKQESAAEKNDTKTISEQVLEVTATPEAKPQESKMADTMNEDEKSQDDPTRKDAIPNEEAEEESSENSNQEETEKKEHPEEANQEDDKDKENSPSSSETKAAQEEAELTMQIYKVPVDVVERFERPENLASSLSQYLSANGLNVITATYIGNEWEEDGKFCFDVSLPDETIVRVQYNKASGNFMFGFVEG